MLSSARPGRARSRIFRATAAAASAITAFGLLTPIAAAASTQATFSSPIDTPVNGVAKVVATADLNGDHRLDLVAANSQYQNLSVWLGNGDGTFRGEVDYAVGAIPDSLAIADFNGDNKPDVAIGSGEHGVGENISVFLGNGDGTFGPASHLAIGARALAAGDVNGDGKPDLVAGTVETTQANQVDNLSVMLGNGNGTFGAEKKWKLQSRGPAAIAIGDVNHDNKQDLVSANSDGTVSVMLGNGDGTFNDNRQTKTFNLNANDPRSIVIVNLNGDNNPDLVTVNADANDVSVLLGNGDGTFGAATAYALNGGTNPQSLTSGDYNHDGALDLATANMGTGNVSVLLGNGNGTFAAATVLPLPSGTDADAVATDDVNGDGWADLAVDYQKSYDFSQQLGVLLNGQGDTPPTISDIPDMFINGARPAIPFTVGDAETAAGNLTLSATSSDGSVIPVANVVFGGSGADRTVQLTPVAGQSGGVTITVRVSDGMVTAFDTINVDVDITAPKCSVTAIGTDPVSGQKYVMASAQDLDAGIATIDVTTSVNIVLPVTTSPSPVPVGTEDPVDITAYKADQTKAAQVAFVITDQAGNKGSCF